MNDIDILEDLLSTQKQYIEDKDYQKEHNIKEQAIDYAKMWTKATETLIAENKELKERNKRQQENLKITNKKIAAQRGQLMMLNKAYIPKSKVEEVIEELEAMSISQEIYYEDILKILQSLLGKE